MILHDVDAGTRKRFRGFVVANAELEPDRLRVLRENVVKVLWDVGRSPKYVDDVDVIGNRHERAVYRLAEDLLEVGIVNWHWNYFVAGSLRVIGDVTGWLRRIWLDAKYGYAFGSLE